jgi:hypothetical protein
MKQIPSKPTEALNYAAERANRREAIMLAKAHPKMWAPLRAWFHSNCRQTSEQEKMWNRMKDMQQMEERFITGVSALLRMKRYVHSSLSNEPRPWNRVNHFENGRKQNETRELIEHFVKHEKMRFFSPNPETIESEHQYLDNVHQHLQVSGSYAFHLTSQWNDVTGDSIDPFNAEVFAMLRNIAMLFGIRSYHEKQVKSVEVCEQLGINPLLIRYFFRPLDADSSGIHREQYATMSGMARQAAADKRKGKIMHSMTPAQKIVEFAGTMAKVKGGRLLPFAEVMEGHRASRRTAEAYMDTTKESPVFVAARNPMDCLNPEFAGIWEEIYVDTHAEFAQKGIDFDAVRRIVAQKNGLQL